MIQRKRLVVGDHMDIRMLFPEAKTGDTYRIDVHTQYPNENIQSTVVEVEFVEPIHRREYCEKDNCSLTHRINAHQRNIRVSQQKPHKRLNKTAKQ